jgi:hypothetical protein
MTTPMKSSTAGDNERPAAPGRSGSVELGSDRGRGESDPGPAGPWRTGATLAAHVLALSDPLQVLANVGSDRARLRLRRALALVPGLLLGGTVLVVGAVYGTFLFASGLAQVLEGLLERSPGLGRLVAGLLLLLSGAGGLLLWRDLRARHDLKRLLAKYGRHAPSTEPPPAARSEHGASPDPHARSAPG